MSKSGIVYATMFVCLAACVGGPLSPAQAQTWRSYTELEGRAGDSPELGQLNLFAPIWQDSDSILFADVRGFQDDQSVTEGNWGLAFRTVIDGEWIFGINGFFDLRRTALGNEFSQSGFGFELLDVNRGFRFNAYIPNGGTESVAGLNGAFLQNGNIVIRSGLEASYYGMDLEAERLMWFHDGDSSSINSSKMDLELWAAAGMFHFDNNTAGLDAITGPRVRTELRLFDLPLLGNDSRVVLAGQYGYDDVRGSVGTGIVSVRIPFGPGGGRTGRRLKGLARRMVAPIERDIDIVTNAGAVSTEAAQIASTGETISQVLTIDGNTANLTAVVTNAGANSVVIASGGAGMITPGSSIILNNGQVLLGGGSSLEVIGVNTGTAATFNAPGSRPTINSGVFSAIRVATDASVIGLNISGGSIGIVTINDGTDDLAAGSQILNNNVTSAIIGFAFNNVNAGAMVTGNTATDSQFDGFSFSNVNAGGVVTGNTATGSGGFDGILFNNGNGFTFLDVNGTFSNNTATDGGENGFRFRDVNVGGMFTGNIANNNIERGYRGNDSGGVITGNTGTGNVGGGNTFP